MGEKKDPPQKITSWQRVQNDVNGLAWKNIVDSAIVPFFHICGSNALPTTG